MVTIEIAINFTRGAQHFALHPAGISLPSAWCF